MEALKQHVSAGSNLNEKEPPGGSSLLISACLFGKTNMAKVLIDAEADINFQNNNAPRHYIQRHFFADPKL